MNLLFKGSYSFINNSSLKFQIEYSKMIITKINLMIIHPIHSMSRVFLLPNHKALEELDKGDLFPQVKSMNFFLLVKIRVQFHNFVLQIDYYFFEVVPKQNKKDLLKKDNTNMTYPHYICNNSTL